MVFLKIPSVMPYGKQQCYTFDIFFYLISPSSFPPHSMMLDKNKFHTLIDQSNLTTIYNAYWFLWGILVELPVL